MPRRGISAFFKRLGLNGYQRRSAAIPSRNAALSGSWQVRQAGIARRPALSSLWPQSLRRLDAVSGDAIAPRLRLHPRAENPHHIFKQIQTRNAAEEHPEVAATIAVSMFSPAVTAAAPRNLLVIDGDWEDFVESARASALSASTAPLVIGSNYRRGDTSPDILALQLFLNAHGFTISMSGSGSPGEESDYFGLKTFQALVRFQKAEELPATGWLGPMTRAVIAE